MVSSSRGRMEGTVADRGRDARDPARARRGAGPVAAADARRSTRSSAGRVTRSSPTGARRGCTASGSRRRRVGAVEEVARDRARPRAARASTWWLGELDDARRPRRAAAASSGSCRTDPPELTTSLTLPEPPRGEPPRSRCGAATTLDDYSCALEIDWEVFGVPDDERASAGRRARRAWPCDADARPDARRLYLAVPRRRAGRLRPRRSSRRAAALLMGGATLPAARGRGVYTSLVHARWARGGRARHAAARRQRGPDVGPDPRAARLRAASASVQLCCSDRL